MTDSMSRPRGSGAPASGPPAARAEDAEAQFQALVQSPLRAGILRHLNARPAEAFDVDALMRVFGHLRLDVERCVRELADVGVARGLETPGAPVRYTATRPPDARMAASLDAFLQRRAPVTPEDQSTSVRRFRELIGRDEKMLVVFEWIRTAAKADIAVLILGPTGTGKEMVARMIHELSRRSTGRMQAVNCAALPDSLFESEMFGHEKGAFTGAHERRTGRLELSDGGTLFLDEVGDLSPVAQAKLLRVLEERRFERLGGQRAVTADFRLISATNRPLDQFVREGRFREDLLYRINAFAIRLPSLRERRADIVPLAERVLARHCAAQGHQDDHLVFARDALDRLLAYPWPGNIRELESAVARAALSASDRVIRAGDLAFLDRQPGTAAAVPLPTLAEAERTHVLRVLEAVGWNKQEAARVLAVSRGTLYRKIAEYSLAPTIGRSG